MSCCRRKYGFFSFLWDCFMVCVTGGFWIIYILVRESRLRKGCC